MNNQACMPVLVGFVVLVFALLGSACVVRMVGFFRDYVELSVANQALILRRPKLFGGISERVLPFKQMLSVSCNGHRRYHNKVGYRVHWSIAIAGLQPRQIFMQFAFKNFPGDTSVTKPPDNVLNMVNGIRKLMGTPQQNILHPLKTN